MPRYLVRLIVAGSPRDLEVDAADADAARGQVAARGRVLSVRRRRRLSLPAGALTREERHIVFTRLASALDSRVGTVEALRRLGAVFTGRIRRAALGLAEAVESGDDLATAMGRRPRDFPPEVVALVRAGGFGRGTPAALREAAAWELETAGLAEGLRATLFLTAVQCVFAIAIMVVSAHLIAPMLFETEMFRQIGDPARIDWVLALSDAGCVAVGLLLAAGLVLGASRSTRKTERWARGLPIFRELAFGVRDHAAFHELSLLVAGGVPLERALTLAANGASRSALGDDLRAAAAAVAAGGDWAAALRVLPLVDRAALAAVDNREELARATAQLAQQNRDLFLHAVRVVRPALTTLATSILAVSGGILFGTAILPILQIADQVARSGLTP